jgi:hypothetical protein
MMKSSSPRFMQAPRQNPLTDGTTASLPQQLFDSRVTKVEYSVNYYVQNGIKRQFCSEISPLRYRGGLFAAHKNIAASPGAS